MKTPLFQMTSVSTRGSFATSIAIRPPHDWPIIATVPVSILPASGLPARVFSLMPQSMAWVRCVPVAPPGIGVPIVAAISRASFGPTATTRKPCDAIFVR